MGTADRIERERAEKRSRILDAARDLFVERGVEAVTLREIAERIEYSTTAIYVQFKDKAALVEEMVRADFAAFAGSLEANAKIVDPVERIGALHDAYVVFALTMPRHYQLLFLTPPVPHATKQGDSPAGIEGYRVLLATVDECIRTGRFRAALTDADAVAQAVWANVHGLVALQIVMGVHPQFHWRPREVLSRTSFDLVMHGLLRDPDELPALGSATTSRRRRAKPRRKS